MDQRETNTSQEIEFTDLFRQQGKAGTLLYPLLPLFLYFDGYNSESLFWIATAITLVFTLFRLFLLFATSIISSHFFARLYPPAVLLNSTAISLFAVCVFSNQSDPSGIVLFTLFIAALVGGGMISMAASKKLAISNAAILLTPLVVGYFMYFPGDSRWLMALSAFMFFPFGFKQMNTMSGILNELKASKDENDFQKQRIEKFMNQVPGMMSWFNSDLEYIECNQILLDKINVSKADLLGRKVGHRGGRSQFKDALNKFIESDQNQLVTELILNIGNSTTTYLTLFSKYIHHEKIEYSALSFDISEIKEKEVELERQKIHLLQQEKMLAMGEMASGIAHEVNNPLAIIAGKAELIMNLFKTNKANSENVVRHLESIVTTSFRISKIINGLKKLAKDSRMLDVNNYKIEEVIEPVFDINHAKLYNAGIELRTKIQSPNVQVQCSLVEISQVLLNLIINSSHAIENLNEKWIQIETQETDLELNIRISDSGSGIPEETQKKLFQPFFTTKAPGKGTGIGLSLSRELMRKQGGDLFLDEKAHHTTFVIRLLKSVRQSQSSDSDSKAA